jgi:hypothetical protein
MPAVFGTPAILRDSVVGLSDSFSFGGIRYGQDRASCGQGLDDALSGSWLFGVKLTGNGQACLWLQSRHGE